MPELIQFREKRIAPGPLAPVSGPAPKVNECVETVFSRAKPLIRASDNGRVVVFDSAVARSPAAPLGEAGRLRGFESVRHGSITFSLSIHRGNVAVTAFIARPELPISSDN